MSDILNVEIKARLVDPAFVRKTLKELKADFRGIDNQTDTYFNCPNGRLKLRQGNIENSLIFYRRPDNTGPRESEVNLTRLAPGTNLRETLAAALGVKVRVKKTREIYFAGNVKFHIDNVEGLGAYCEIEAIDETGSIGRDELYRQCRHYMALLRISESHTLDCSYSDLLLGLSGKK